MPTKATHSKPGRAGIYARISEDRHDDGLGVERQLRDCRKLARERRLTVVEEFVDNDMSASNGKRRPAFERLLAEVEAGRIDAVVVWHPDRLYRRARELERIIDVVEQAGTKFATVRAGDFDLATAT